MPLFGHIESGFALDVQQNSDRNEYLARYSAGVSAHWFVAELPGDTIHGAKDNGNGTFSNPVTAPLLKLPTTLSASGFQDVCESGLGSTARFGAVIRAMESSADDRVYSAFQRFSKSITFDKVKAAPLFSLLAGVGIMTAQERTDILNAWPVQ